jgi:hypothetical protein
MAGKYAHHNCDSGTQATTYHFADEAGRTVPPFTLSFAGEACGGQLLAVCRLSQMIPPNDPSLTPGLRWRSIRGSRDGGWPPGRR